MSLIRELALQGSFFEIKYQPNFLLFIAIGPSPLNFTFVIDTLRKVGLVGQQKKTEKNSCQAPICWKKLKSSVFAITTILPITEHLHHFYCVNDIKNKLYTTVSLLKLREQKMLRSLIASQAVVLHQAQLFFPYINKINK